MIYVINSDDKNGIAALSDKPIYSIPPTLEDAVSIMKEEEYALISQYISWIEDERTKPRKKQDTFYLQSICYYLSDLYNTDYKRSSGEPYPAISESFYDYLVAEGQGYTQFLKKVERKKNNKKLKRRKAVGVTLIVLSALLICTLISYAFGFEPFEYIKEFIGMPVGERVPIDDGSFIYRNDYVDYNSIEELCEDMNIDILSPTYLPEDIVIQSIRVSNISSMHKEAIYIFSSNEIRYTVYTYEAFNISILMDKCIKYIVNDIEYYIFENASYYIAYFEYENNQYVLQSPEYDELIKMIDNLRSMPNEKGN